MVCRYACYVHGPDLCDDASKGLGEIQFLSIDPRINPHHDHGILQLRLVFVPTHRIHILSPVGVSRYLKRVSVRYGYWRWRSERGALV